MRSGGVLVDTSGPHAAKGRKIETKRLSAHYSCAGEVRGLVRIQPWQRRSEYRVYKQLCLVDLCPRQLQNEVCGQRGLSAGCMPGIGGSQEGGS